MKKDTFIKSWLRVPPDKASGGSEIPAQQSPKKVPVMLVQVRDDDIERAASLIATVVESVSAADGTIFHIISSIIVATFDFGFNDLTDAESRCQAAAQSVHRILQNDCKILYGSPVAIYGNFGTPTRIHHGPFFRGISDFLEQLRKMDFGSVDTLSGS